MPRMPAIQPLELARPWLLELPPINRLMPIFEIEGERVVMMTPQIAGISTSDIGPVVTSLAAHRFEIRTAIDILTGDL